MMGNIKSAKIIVEHAKKYYENSTDDYNLFINIKMSKD
jgi:hypothetical protein